MNANLTLNALLPGVTTNARKTQAAQNAKAYAALPSYRMVFPSFY